MSKGASVWGVVTALVLAATGFTVNTSLGDQIQRVSFIDGSQSAAGGDGDSVQPILTPDGRYVLFASLAKNLILNSNANAAVARLMPRLNVFVRDRTNGTTTLVSADLLGNGSGNGDSLPSQISADGRYVLFESEATNLVAGDTNGLKDIFLRDLSNATTFLVSGAAGASANGASYDSVMTPDARYIAFASAASNLVAGDSNGIPDVFVRDMQTSSNLLVSAGAVSTNSSTPSGGSRAPEISPDGRYVAFYSTATNLVPGVQSTGDIYVRDLLAATTTDEWRTALFSIPKTCHHATSCPAANPCPSSAILGNNAAPA